MIEIFDDYLSAEDYKQLYDIVTSHGFKWNRSRILHDPNDPGMDKHQDYIFTGGDSNFNIQFVKLVYCIEQKKFDESLIYGCLSPLFKKLKINRGDAVKSKFNITFNHGVHVNSGFHTDNSYENCKTAIYYVNDNNGYTEFEEDGTKVISKANRLVVFPSNLRHSGVSCTDKRYRIVLNLNWLDCD